VTNPHLPVSELLEFYAVLGRDVAAQESTTGALEAVSQVAVKAVAGAQFASITRWRGQAYRTVAPTDLAALTADTAQYDLRSGPCLDALGDDALIVTGDVIADPRWPQWGLQVNAALGIMSVMAVRLVVDDDDMVAALNIYSRDKDAFTGESLAMAMLLATHGALALARVTAREKAANLMRAVTTNREIGMAMGVLMSTYKIAEDEAFNLLRITSQNTHRKLNSIARKVIETGTLELPKNAPSRPNPRSESH
jgi:hypothetical protein